MGLRAPESPSWHVHQRWSQQRFCRWHLDSNGSVDTPRFPCSVAGVEWQGCTCNLAPLGPCGILCKLCRRKGEFVSWARGQPGRAQVAALTVGGGQRDKQRNKTSCGLLVRKTCRGLQPTLAKGGCQLIRKVVLACSRDVDSSLVYTNTQPGKPFLAWRSLLCQSNCFITAEAKMKVI